MAIVVAIDGVDGCGKTTQLTLLKKTLEESGLKVLSTKAIGSDLHPATEKLRDIALSSTYKISAQAQQLIFAANALILRQEIIEKNSNEYHVILLDRSYYSFHAYGLPLIKDQTWLSLVSDFVGFSRPPDFTFLLDIDPEISYERAIGRVPEKFESGGEDVIESKGLSYQKQVSLIFKYFVESGMYSIVPINVNNKTIEEVHSEIIESSFIKQLIQSK